MTNLLVDTHTHLYDPVFDPDRTAVLENAERVGVGAVITVSEDLNDAERTLELAGRHKMIRPAAGLYPTILDNHQADRMEAFIRNHRMELAAIGEVGLDYWKVKEPEDKEIQRNIFGRFIDLSKELKMPLNVHSRSAGRHAVNLLLESSATRVQMHAFDGKASAALPAVEAGQRLSHQVIRLVICIIKGPILTCRVGGHRIAGWPATIATCYHRASVVKRVAG